MWHAVFLMQIFPNVELQERLSTPAPACSSTTTSAAKGSPSTDMPAPLLQPRGPTFRSLLGPLQLPVVQCLLWLSLISHLFIPVEVALSNS